MFILAGEMYIVSCYFVEGNSLLWQANAECGLPAAGGKTRAGAVIWAQQQGSGGLAAITAAGSYPAQGQGGAIRQGSTSSSAGLHQGAAHQPAPDGHRPQHGGGASGPLRSGDLQLGQAIKQQGTAQGGAGAGQRKDHGQTPQHPQIQPQPSRAKL